MTDTTAVKPALMPAPAAAATHETVRSEAQAAPDPALALRVAEEAAAKLAKEAVAAADAPVVVSTPVTPVPVVATPAAPVVAAATPTTPAAPVVAASTSATGVAPVAPAQVFYVVANKTTGVITQKGHVPASDAAVSLTAMGATEITVEQYAQVQRGYGRVALVNGQIVPIAAVSTGLSTLRATWNLRVDQAAERARYLFLPIGAGQQMEDRATLAEARAVAAAADPLDATKFPWLSADVAAAATSGDTLTLREAADAAIAANATWVAAGVAIKQVRLTAQAAIAAATTAPQMQAIVNGLKWPTKA